MKNTLKRFFTMLAVLLLCFSLPVYSFSEEAAEKTAAEGEPIELLPMPIPEVYSINYIKPDPEKPEAPVLTKQPQSITVEAGETAWFSVAAEGTELAYLWQELAPGGIWTDTDCTAPLFSFTVSAEQDGYQYRCIVSSMGESSVASEAAALFVIKTVTENGIKYEKTVSGMMVVKCITPAKSIVIPNSINGVTVTRIGPAAFENQTMLESIDLPDTIEIIGTRAFAGCINLSSMS